MKKKDLTTRPKENTSEGFPMPLPACPSGLRHMTLPILGLRSFSPSNLRAQSRSPNTTRSTRISDPCRPSISQLSITLLSLRSAVGTDQYEVFKRNLLLSTSHIQPPVISKCTQCFAWRSFNANSSSRKITFLVVSERSLLCLINDSKLSWKNS